MPQEPLKTGSVERGIEEARLNGGLAVYITSREEAKTQAKEERPQMKKRTMGDVSKLGMAIAEISEHLSKNTRKTVGKTSLTSTKRSTCEDDTGSDKCGVCGNVLAYGDVFYAIDLANFGYSKHTERVCALCKDTICDKVLG